MAFNHHLAFCHLGSQATINETYKPIHTFSETELKQHRQTHPGGALLRNCRCLDPPASPYVAENCHHCFATAPQSWQLKKDKNMASLTSHAMPYRKKQCIECPRRRFFTLTYTKVTPFNEKTILIDSKRYFPFFFSLLNEVSANPQGRQQLQMLPALWISKWK